MTNTQKKWQLSAHQVCDSFDTIVSEVSCKRLKFGQHAFTNNLYEKNRRSTGQIACLLLTVSYALAQALSHVQTYTRERPDKGAHRFQTKLQH